MDLTVRPICNGKEVLRQFVAEVGHLEVALHIISLLKFFCWFPSMQRAKSKFSVTEPLFASLPGPLLLHRFGT